jgi:hypothetical protein
MPTEITTASFPGPMNPELRNGMTHACRRDPLARDEKTVHERRVHVALEVIPTRIRRHRERHVLYVVRACLDLGADDRRRRRVRAIEEVPVMLPLRRGESVSSVTCDG